MQLLVFTGPIGSGKSTAAKMSAEELEKRGIPYMLLDLDDFARGVISGSQKILADLADAFGPYVLDSDGGLNRQALAIAAFKNPDTAKTLNEITHPAIIISLGELLKEFARKHEDGVAILESPYPYEMLDYNSHIVFINASLKDRQAHNERFTTEDFLKRGAVQPSEESYRLMSDLEIENTFSEPLMRSRIASLTESL